MKKTLGSPAAIILLFGWIATGQQAPAPAVSARQAAPIDLTGYWVSLATEDWRWRMLTPPKGDSLGVPLNAEGIRVANSWDPASDEAAGNQCRAYGSAAIMRQPIRLHITWQDDNTLRIDTDAGQQTRLLHFTGSSPVSAARQWQGYSAASWQSAGRGQNGTGSLKVATTEMRAGYLRKNGVPYSENASLTEYFDRHNDFGAEWFTIIAIVEDPLYLTEPFIVSSHFKREADGSKWDPTPCETGRPSK